MDDEKVCMDLILRSRKLLEQNRADGLRLARQAAAMETVSIRLKIAAKGVLEVGLRKSGDFQAALQVCEACIADPDMDERGKRIFERSAARCEWRLGFPSKAIARLKVMLSQSDSDDTRALLEEIEDSVV